MSTNTHRKTLIYAYVGLWNAHYVTLFGKTILSMKNSIDRGKVDKAMRHFTCNEERELLAINFLWPHITLLKYLFFGIILNLFLAVSLPDMKNLLSGHKQVSLAFMRTWTFYEDIWGLVTLRVIKFTTGILCLFFRNWNRSLAYPPTSVALNT